MTSDGALASLFMIPSSLWNAGTHRDPRRQVQGMGLQTRVRLSNGGADPPSRSSGLRPSTPGGTRLDVVSATFIHGIGTYERQMRIRHEYRCSLGKNREMGSSGLPSTYEVRNPRESDVPGLAQLMFDSYQGTIDYDGENLQEATAEVKSYFERVDSAPMPSCSFIALSGSKIVSACLVSNWEKRPEPLIAYLMTRRNLKGQGLAKALVLKCLQSVQDAGYAGAIGVVTEGNTPSERLLVGLGFIRAQ